MRRPLPAGRRLQNLGGLVHKQGLIPAPLPSWLQPLLARLARDTGAYGPGQLPNHVLINAYQPGEGIMPHEARQGMRGCGEPAWQSSASRTCARNSAPRTCAQHAASCK